MLKIIMTFISIVLAFSGPCIANEHSKIKKLEQALDTIRDTHNIPALSVAIIDKGEPIYSAGFGYLGSSSQPVTKHTLFRIASITKLLTAQAIMQLVEQNKMQLDDDVKKYISLFSNKDIKIVDLLTHTSGLADVIRPISFEDKRSFNTYLKESISQNDSAHNKDFNYADLNFNLLGRIVEIVSGSSYSEYIKRNILNKAGLTNSDFNQAESNFKPDVTPNYNYGFTFTAPTRPYDISYLPSEGLISSVDELSKWLISTLNQDVKLLQKSAFKEMLTPIRKTNWGKIEMGLGWQIYTKNDKLVAQHAGSITGYKSLLITYPETKRAIIILANAKNVPRWQIAKVINAILDDKEYTLPSSEQGKYKTYILLTCLILLLGLALLIRSIVKKKVS